MNQSEQRTQQFWSSSAPDAGLYSRGSFPGNPRSNSHTSEEPSLYVQEVACPFCPSSFPEHLLKSHISRCHGSTMPFSCTVCGRGYLSKTGLYYHMTAHSGKAIQCPVCGKTFARKFTLNRHMREAHAHVFKGSWVIEMLSSYAWYCYVSKVSC